MSKKILVAGGGGMIGSALVNRLVNEGHDVYVADIKKSTNWYQLNKAAYNEERCDLSLIGNCELVCKGMNEVYNLAASMGGIGFIELNKSECISNVLINSHMLQAAVKHGVEKFFFSSSACAYNVSLQAPSDKALHLKESDAWPALPEKGYGLEKLYAEEACMIFEEDYNIKCRVARYFNVYGPFCTWDGGREKSPAAICRKVAHAVQSGNHDISIWGDGNQLRNFTYIDDCVEGTRRIMDGSYNKPLNLGSSECVTINQLVTLVEEIAGVKLHRQYQLDAPKGVGARNTDNTLIKAVLGWEPSISLRTGLEKTYAWIYDELKAGRSGK